MDNITPQSIYIIDPAIKERTNEFTLEDQKGNVLSYLERKENMYCFTKEELEKVLSDYSKWLLENTYMNGTIAYMSMDEGKEGRFIGNNELATTYINNLKK